MNSSNVIQFTIFIVFLYRPVAAQVVLSEIMFDAFGSESHEEFVEIVNLSPEDVDLSGWQITDGSGNDFIMSHEEGTLLEAGQFGIILDPTYFENSTAYDSLIPESALILTLNNNTFGSAGLSNSTAETVALIDSKGDTVSSYTYSLGNSPGFSDEKVKPAGENIPENWLDAKNLYGTPGSQNSRTPLNFNLAFSGKGLTIAPNSVRPGEEVSISLKVQNIGLNDASDFSVTLFIDLNANSEFDSGEELDLPIITDFVVSGDSLVFLLKYTALKSGAYIIYAEIYFDLDEDTSDNSVSDTLMVRFDKGAVKVNEIMYSPLDGQPEWVELINTSTESIELQSWAISDNQRKPVRINQSLLLNQGEFLVVSKDSLILDSFDIPSNALFIMDSLPTLNSNHDDIILYDLTGNKIDSVNYSDSWGGSPGISLEKRLPSLDASDSRNWGSSIALAGGTPGWKNSLVPPEYDLEVLELILSPENIRYYERSAISAVIKNVGLSNADNFEISYFADYNSNGQPDAGEVFNSSEFNGDLAANDSVILSVSFDGQISGAYNIFAELNFGFDTNILNNSYSKMIFVGYREKVIRINEIMYSPLAGQPEWVELLNTSDETIDLKNLGITDDALDFENAIENSILIQPNEFIVICKDSSILEYFNPPNFSLNVFNKLPSFNNSNDSVILFDLTDSVIDQVNYTEDWGGSTGIALEKINPAFDSNDSLAWDSSVIFEGGTPGQTNSIFSEILPSNSKLSISPNPFSPDGDGHDDNAIISYNLPARTALINIKIYDLRGRLIRFLANSKPSGASSDTIPAISWDGKNDNRELARIGIYIVFLEALNAQSGILATKKQTVVLAGKL